MSIAVTANIRPSKWLAAIVGTFCAATIAILLAFAIFGANQTFWSHSVLVTACIAVGYYWRQFLVKRENFRLEITGTGQIRIAHVQSPESTQLQTYSLLPNSTLWAGLIVLCLEAEDNQTLVLLILPDSVDTDTFRQLSVASRWIAHVST